MPRQTVTINPEVIIWARKDADLTPEAAAAAIGVDTEILTAWEGGEGGPSIGELRKMSAAYSRPLTALLQPSIPPVAPMPRSFRTVGGVAPRLTRDAILAIRDAQRIQALATDLLEDDPTLLAEPKISRYDMQDSAIECGMVERDEFGVSRTDQRKFRHAGEAYNAWRSRLQMAGIIVIAKPMDRLDCRGFSLYEQGRPTIVVNSREVDQAKIFTLFHEYAHLVLGQGGICLERNSIPIERWCNRFAASFLVPRAWLEMELPEIRVTSIGRVAELAKKFRVSRQVIALRLYEIGRGDYSLYQTIKRRDDRRDFTPEPPSDRESDFRIPQPRAKLSEVGIGFGGIVIGAMERGVIDRVAAVEYLGIEPRTLEPFAQLVKDAADRYG